MSKISYLLLKILGWKIVGELPPFKKFVIIGAPHTSNWDFIIGRAYFFIYNIPVQFFIKKEWFFFPMNLLLKVLGAIPVNRGKNTKLTEEIIKSFDSRENLVMLVTPEGTRKYNPDWKKGFYYIALGAKVPIVLGFVDYSTKTAGIGPHLYPSGNIEEDMKFIKDFYRTKKGRFPEQGVR
ncbi:MAG: lysophospholipid acyltransferase family protein [Flavobacteriales bacterium]|nr:lysophospholipid acyltransferase family protein [Flavobacteriales bacterium]